MTNEEAIYLLRNTGWLAPSLEPIDEAIEMACEALRKTEPQTCSVNGRPYSECANCEHFRCTADEPQAERSE